MQDKRPDDVAEEDDFDDDKADQDKVNNLLVMRTASMPAGVGDFGRLGGELKIGQNFC
jgi:hypothetical protein